MKEEQCKCAKKQIDFMECCKDCENITRDKDGEETADCSDDNCKCHKEEQISDSWEIELENLPNTNMTTKDFIKQTLAKQKEEIVEKIDKLQVYYLPSKNGREEVVILQDIINLINNKAE